MAPKKCPSQAQPKSLISKPPPRATALRKFHYFSKLPIEIRLRIWNASMEPRVIRAKWENEITPTIFRTLYRLTGGPVPKIFQVNRESREEAKCQYNLLNARLAFSFTPTQAHRPESIYINYDIDTIYFVNYPEAQGFLRWVKRSSFAANGPGRKKIQRVAINGDAILRLCGHNGATKHRLDVLYSLFQNHPTISDFKVVLDGSNFSEDKGVAKYSFKEAKGTSSAAGKWRAQKNRDAVDMAMRDFFTVLRGNGEALETWKRWRVQVKNWVEPDIGFVAISKTRGR